MYEISIIIPTHNRSELLDVALEKIYANKFPKNKYQVIVIDDASTDKTEQICRKWGKSEKLIYHKQKKAGQAVARNKGLELSEGKIIIFGQDDIFYTQNFLNEHYSFHLKHRKNNYACLGLILWDPNLEITDLMKWSTNELTFAGKFGGHQFAYNQLKNGQAANYNYFYTSNISLKRDLLLQERFDPWFDGYGWEDIELGLRLQKKHDLKIIYNSAAVAYHHHPINLDDFKKRMIQVGYSLHLFENKHPEIKQNLSSKKLSIFKLISNKASIKTIQILNFIFKNKLNPLYFYCLSKKYFLVGYDQIPSKLRNNEN